MIISDEDLFKFWKHYQKPKDRLTATKKAIKKKWGDDASTLIDKIESY